MGMTRPPLSQLIQESQLDLVSRFDGTGVPLPRSVLTILATSFANGFDALYGKVEQVAKNILADTSEDEVLLRQAADRGLSLELATPAGGNVIFKGTLGFTLPAHTVVVRGGDGATFTVNADLTITSGTTVTGPVTATLAGAAGNTPGGASVTLGSSVSGFQTGATVGGDGLTGGADVETIEALRVRVLEFDQDEATGGNVEDYIAWAKLIPGVTRAWAYKSYSGAGSVGLTFVKDNDPTSIIPTSGDLTAMQTWIDLVAPGTATNVIFAPNPIALNPHIHLVGADTTAIRQAVNAELRDLISQGVQPDGTLGAAPGGTTYLNSQIIPAISAAPGVVDFTLSQLAGVSPADIVLTVPDMLVLGTPVYS